MHLKFFGITFASLFLGLLLLTVFYYFNILSTGAVSILRYIILLLITLVSSIHIGRKSTKKGWLQGLKFGLIFISFLFFFSLTALSITFRFRIILYYLILITTSIFGSMIGINIRKKG